MELIPEELRELHEDGHVIFFCGAGVSMPAGLPSFKKLVELVLADLIPPDGMCKPGSADALAWRAFREDNFDQALDILESPLAGGYEPAKVRERVQAHLKPSNVRTLKNHEILVRLSDLDTEGGRLITTNFDPLFERAQVKIRRSEHSKYQLRTCVAPSLPPAKPRAWSGLAYLHGKLDSSPNNQGLVLTTKDFGTAYLLEGWARRFVVDLFTHYSVVFVGYRVEDPTMRYLVSALAAARGEGAHFRTPYVFAPFKEGDGGAETSEEAEQEWRLKGLTPLTYDATGNHGKLWQELEEWANDHRQGILGRRQKVAALAKFPPSQENDPAIRELTWALKDKEIARFFADMKNENRPSPRWLAPLQLSGAFSLPIAKSEDGTNIASPLVSQILPDYLGLNEATRNLAIWVANCIDTQEALDWAINGGGVLHRFLRLQIRDEIKRATLNIPAGLRKIWRALSSDEYAYALSQKRSGIYFDHPRLSVENYADKREFLKRLRPIPIFKPKIHFFRELREPDPERPADWCDISLELVGVEHAYHIDRYREKAIDWAATLATIAEDLTTLLAEAMDWLQEFGLASAEEDRTHIEYRSVSEHSQNKHAHTWTQLIALTRDSFDALKVENRAAALRLTRRWQGLRYPIFRRLMLYAAT